MSAVAHYVDGIPIPPMFPADKFRSALSYKPIPQDVFLVTYPKCGTTWAGQVLLLLLQKGEPLKDSDLEKAPFLEMAGAKRIEGMFRPGIIKTHLPFYLVPWSKDAKYIYVTRNPKDCCVSFYHYSKHLPSSIFEGTFDDFFEFFMEDVPKYAYFGDYFDHLLSWYTQRNEPNILIITYEEMKEDIGSAILKMASFIDDEKYAKPLRDNSEILKSIKEQSTLKAMQENISKISQGIAKMTPEELLKSSLPDTIKDYLVLDNEALNPAGATINLPERFNLISKLVRKGVVGDWKNYFSEKQNQRLEERFEQKTNGTDIPKWWIKCMKSN